MNKYKIALIGSGISSGGLVSMLSEFLNYHPGDRVDVALFCTKKFADQYKDINANIRIVITDSLYENKWTNLFGLRYKKEFVRIINDYSPDAVFFITGSSKFGLDKYRSYIVLNNQLFTDFSKVFKQQSLNVSITTFILGLKFRIRTRFISHIFFSSEFSKRESANILRTNKQSVIPFACNKSFIKQEVTDASISKNVETFKLLNIGSIIPYKNQETVIDALSILKEKGYNFYITFIGRTLSKKYKSVCLSKVMKYGLENQVSFIEWLEPSKVIECIDQCDIYINSSETDTCATSVEEGMARIKPVVASDTLFNKEMVRDGGLYYSLNSPESLARAIASYFENDNERFRLATKGYEIAKQWSLTDTARCYYNEIIKDLDEVNGE